MLDSKKLEKMTQLANQYSAWVLKWERWLAMSDSGIGSYLIHHDEIFGWETYWTRFNRLQKYAYAKMEECLQQQQAISDKLTAMYQEGL